MKKVHANALLKVADALADRGGGDRQFLCGTGEIAVTRTGFEDFQALKGWSRKSHGYVKQNFTSSTSIIVMLAVCHAIASLMFSRREFGGSIGGAMLAASLKRSDARTPSEATLIAAPCNLGLRPLRDAHIPGAWRGPDVLEAAGIAAAVGARSTIRLPRPDYQADAVPASRIRNGPALRAFNEQLALEVQAAIADKSFPVVIGGDCSILLGCLAGARTNGRLGLVHVDGHSDFFHPGNYDAEARLGSAAGMDLALATGRGEPLLAIWDGTPLVEDRYVSQIGERDELDPDYAYRDIETTRIRRFPVRSVRKAGIEETICKVLAPVNGERPPFWLHVDLDVLDEDEMPAVDSPGSPGMTFDELERLISGFLASGRIFGLDLTIYDPDLDPTGRYARDIVRTIERAFRSWRG